MNRHNLTEMGKWVLVLSLSAVAGNASAQAYPVKPVRVVIPWPPGGSNDVVGRIAPRPLLLLHPADDSVTPTEQSIELFLHAGQPTDLHLVAGVDHFLLAEDNPLVIDLVRNWLSLHIPA